jgi:hypothetical protein
MGFVLQESRLADWIGIFADVVRVVRVRIGG